MLGVFMTRWMNGRMTLFIVVFFGLAVVYMLKIALRENVRGGIDVATRLVHGKTLLEVDYVCASKPS